MDVKIEEGWKKALADEFDKPYFKTLTDMVRAEYADPSVRVYPPAGRIFEAFNESPFADTKVVIIGQDPYHGPGQANGLAFSVGDGVMMPPSLRNIFREVNADTGASLPYNGDLSRWARQGVLLLNSTLTVREHQPRSHAGRGWETFTDAAVKALKACNGHGIPFIKPWEGKELFEKIDRVLADGSPILGVDVDAAGLITLRKMGRPVMPMSVTELETVVRYVHDMGRKFIVKGIMTPDDAHRAIDAGCDAIVVSNHGGRVLDHCPGTATVLPAIADAVRGRITILADGAVRDGVDVLKMLALGADAVLVGRPLCIAAIGGGVEGVTRYWQQMQGQLVQAMLLTGCASLADVREHIIYRG